MDEHAVGDLVDGLRAQQVVGVSIAWVDNNGIVRSRMVPLAGLPAAIERGVGVTTAFAVFDSHDGITFAHEGLATPSGDVRLLPVVDGPASVRALAGRPGTAWVPGRQVAADGSPWPYDQRSVLERQVAAAADAGFTVRAGQEMEVVLSREGEEYAPAHRGPAYSANALGDVHEVVHQLLVDLDADGVEVGQLHAEYGEAQIELTLVAQDPVALCDTQVRARQTVHAAARAHGLRASFAPVTTAAGAGNGWHLHTSLSRDGRNALTGDGPHGLSEVGRGYLAGLLRELPGIVAVTAPSTGSLLRRRPGFWAGAYGFWGVENREAALRLVPASALMGPENTNVELKASDASANPYLALAVVIAAGLAGVADGAPLPEPIQEDVGTWDDARREAAGVAALSTTHEEQRAHLLGSELVRDVLGPDLLGAFVACRDADAAWAEGKDVEEVVASLRWQY
ncbi:glutamine synthetase family protein [Iamia majanohamensis]|uniref:Glutamine synthetase family protein n=1 Tax=Iamia majanohamensis TaxID=467976 RepID=A0AAE9Y9U9_9ACTN|nr:glutamine synthetase family protein [Iamia majanohamensis]WCO67049.1 glutamine synthetase family protein [Iamia majanohamensis]